MLWNRESVRAKIVEIIVETRGVDASKCIDTAMLFEDLGLESIDLIQISWEFEIAFGFPFPTDKMGMLLDHVDDCLNSNDLERLSAFVHEQFHIDTFDTTQFIVGDRVNVEALRNHVYSRFTVAALIHFVEVELRAKGQFAF